MPQFLDVLSVTPLADGRNWRVQPMPVEGETWQEWIKRPFRYESDVAGLIEVPACFVTDMASIPRAFWAILPPWGRYGSAALVHDFCYWSQTLTREASDDVLREAMTLLGVDGSTITEIFGAVRTFGHIAWDDNTALKRSGYSRISPAGGDPPYASAV